MFTRVTSTSSEALLQSKKGRSTLAPGTKPAIMVTPTVIRRLTRRAKLTVRT